MDDLATDALACFRLTRLATEDTITERPRWWLTKRSRFLATLLDCPWCSSVWVAAGIVVVRRTRPWRELAAPLLAMSAVSGLLSEKAG